MKKLIFLALIIIVLVLTNPAKDEYNSWLYEEIMSNSSNMIEKGINSLIFNEKVINSVTTSDDYIIFSIYRTEFNNDYIKFIGIFNNFIPISTNSNDTRSTEDTSVGFLEYGQILLTIFVIYLIVKLLVYLYNKFNDKKYRPYD